MKLFVLVFFLIIEFKFVPEVCIKKEIYGNIPPLLRKTTDKWIITYIYHHSITRNEYLYFFNFCYFE